MSKIKLVIICLYCFSCISTPKVLFDDPVDTKNKSISYQEKKIFSFEESGVFFSNNFEGARLNNVYQKNDSTYVLSILPENEPINLSPFYAFKVWSKTLRNIDIVFDYPDGYKHRYTPKILSNEKWKKSDSSNFKSTDSLSILKLSIDIDSKLVSGQELHNSQEVYNWVKSLTANKESFMDFRKIGSSSLKKPFMVIDIHKGDPRDKPVIVLITRQHPPEVTGYFAFQSFISEIVRESNLSSDFLNKYRILAFPLMNPDGVDLGHWRHSSGGVDLNRDWSVYNQKEIKTTVNFISKVLKKNNSSLVLGLDFHSTYYDVFYTNIERENTLMPEFLTNWFEGLEKNIPNYEVNEQPSRSTQPTSKGWFLNAHNAVGVTYEIGDDTPRDRIKEIGKISASTMMKLLTD